MYLQAKKLLEGGAVMVDIRTPDNFASERIPGAVNVPLFVPVEGTETFDRIKKFVMATAFAMQATGECLCSWRRINAAAAVLCCRCSA